MRALPAVLASLLTLACGPERIGPFDAGVPPDADSGAAPVDAGPRPDGAAGTDAGPPRDAGPFDAGPLAMCPPPGVPLPMVDYTDREAGAFTDPPACSGCPGEVTFERLVSTPGGTVATIQIGLAPDSLEIMCSVAVVSACGRAVFEIPWGEFGRVERTVPLFCGDNSLIVICENSAGRSVRVSDVIRAQPCSAGAIRATLTWDDCGTDHELHIIRNGSRIYDPMNDCTWNDCTYAGGLDWPPTSSPDGDATKDIDDTGASGIENGRVTGAAPGLYHVMVEMWGSITFGCTSTDSTVNLFIDEVPVATLSVPLTLHQVWYVGVIDMPSGVFTAATDLGGRTTTAPITDCSAAWGPTIGLLTGCTLPIPDAI